MTYNGVTASFDGATLTVECWESQVPEDPQPWFRIETDGMRWQGQAINPPIALSDGRLRYVVEMHPIQ